MNLAYSYYKRQCRVCGRKILVEIGLTGTSHNATVSATCAECIGTLTDEFRQQQPEAAEDIERWIRGEDEPPTPKAPVAT